MGCQRTESGRTARQLAGWGLDEVAFTTELVVSELVTNSVRHGGLRPDQEIELTVRASPEHLRVEVAEADGIGRLAGELLQPRHHAGGFGLRVQGRKSPVFPMH